MMNIIKKVYGNGSKKILFDWDILDEGIVEKICLDLDIQIHILDISIVLKHLKRNIYGFVMLKEQEKSLQIKIVQEFNDSVEKYILSNNIKYIHVSTFIFHHSIINKFKNYGVEFSTRVTDDPERSKWYSEPYIKYFDKGICSGIKYDNNILILEMWQKWGCENVEFIPTYPSPKHYDTNEIQYLEKNIELIYVGAINIAKISRISKFKKYFGDRMKLYGNYGNGDWKSIKGIIYKFLNWYFKIGYIQEVSSKELKEIYKKTKIGINIHITDYKGPSNVRSYELPLNGVMQIADNADGYKKLYNVGQEIICYDNIKDAIEKIEYYLKNENERIEIAKAGYKKAWKEYTYEKILLKTLKFIIE